MRKIKIKKAFIALVGFLVMGSFMLSDIQNMSSFGSQVLAATEDAEVADDDYAKYLKYDKYLKYYKRDKYRDYRKAKKKYGFDSSADKFKAKKCYNEIKDLKKKGVSSAERKKDDCYKKYKKYRRYKKYYRPLRKYKKYKKYDKDEYDNDSWKAYNTAENKAAYERWRGTHRREADLGGGSLGPTISVGIHELTEKQIEDDSFRVRAYKASTDAAVPYTVKNDSGTAILSVAAGEQTRVKYVGGGTFRLYNYDSALNDEETLTTTDKIDFVATDSGDVNDIYFVIYHSTFSSSYDAYRDSIRLDHYDPSGSSNDRVWVINLLPLEHYTWGMGEITGTGDMDYNRVMTISYRTYGYWKIKYSTAYVSRGFKVNATPGNQLYYGYDYEETYPNIRTAAEQTRGKIVMYGHRIAITPYSSWTDGRTRSFEERWGSENYPWCQSVSDPYGKHPSKGTSQLFSEGNHMVGLSAHGALDRATAGWDYDRIIKYYYTDVDIYQAY